MPYRCHNLAGSGASALLLLAACLGSTAEDWPASAQIPPVLDVLSPSTSLGGAANSWPVSAGMPSELAVLSPSMSPREVDLAEPAAARPPLTPATSHSMRTVLLRTHTILAFLAAASILVFMIGGGAANVGHRTPPAWGPELVERYPFRTWARHVLVWSILTDLDARRKAAAVILQLRGGAAELVESPPPQAIIAGGAINGVNVDPMTFLMHALSERYAQLGEETRLSAITELMHFTRHGRERIDDLITRFDRIRQRANQEGQMTMSVQGLS